jgi:hypothetical protein
LKRELAYVERLSRMLNALPEEEDEFLEKVMPKYESEIGEEEKSYTSRAKLRAHYYGLFSWKLLLKYSGCLGEPVEVRGQGFEPWNPYRTRFPRNHLSLAPLTWLGYPRSRKIRRLSY